MALLTAHRSCIRLEASGWSRKQPWLLHVQFDFIYKLITLKHWLRTKVDQNKEKLGKNGCPCCRTTVEPGRVASASWIITRRLHAGSWNTGAWCWLWGCDSTFPDRTNLVMAFRSHVLISDSPIPPTTLPKNTLFSLRLTVKLKTKVMLASKD